MSQKCWTDRERERERVKGNMQIERSMPSIYWWSHALRLQTGCLELKTRYHVPIAEPCTFAECVYLGIWFANIRKRTREWLNEKEKDSSYIAYCLLFIASLKCLNRNNSLIVVWKLFLASSPQNTNIYTQFAIWYFECESV